MTTKGHNIIEIIATGPEFIKHGIRGFESAAESLIAGAQKEILIVSYLITKGALPLFEKIVNMAERGICTTVVINSLIEADEIIRDYLLEVQKKSYPLFRVFSFRDINGCNMHAKVMVVDRQKAIVGSANLSWGGIAGNYEIGVLLVGEIVWKIANLIDELIANGK